MRYATKKECSSLLAMLGEESLMACKKRNEPEKSVGVFWVGSYIVTVENFHGGLLLRVTAPLHLDDMDKAEQGLQEAAMRDHGQYHFFVRELAGFALAEITTHGCLTTQETQYELESMISILRYSLKSF